ncbi:hypothetical protein GOODEAATRI_003531, partial [Goodea atripinnis]
MFPTSSPFTSTYQYLVCFILFFSTVHPSFSVSVNLPAAAYSSIFQGLVTTAPLPGQTTALKKMKEQEGNRFMCHLPVRSQQTRTHTLTCMNKDTKDRHVLLNF